MNRARGPADAARRLLGGLALGMLGPLPLWPLLVAHLALPPMAALHLLRTGPDRYLTEDGPRVAGGIAWLAGVQAWASLLADRFPPTVDAAPAPGRPPGPARALARLVTGLPEAALVLAAGALALPAWLAMAGCAMAGRAGPAALARLPAVAVRRHAGYLARQAGLAGPAGQALSR